MIINLFFSHPYTLIVGMINVPCRYVFLVSVSHQQLRIVLPVDTHSSKCLKVASIWIKKEAKAVLGRAHIMEYVWKRHFLSLY